MHGELEWHIRSLSDVDLVEYTPVKDPALFQQFSVHPDFHTLTWPNGADIAPEFLHEKVQLAA